MTGWGWGAGVRGQGPAVFLGSLGAQAACAGLGGGGKRWLQCGAGIFGLLPAKAIRVTAV